jgi:protein TonB
MTIKFHKTMRNITKSALSLLILILFCSIQSNAQVPDDNKVWESVEQDPQFPGGQEALLKWVSDNLRYPSVAKEEGIQGRVVVQFVVKIDGSIGTVKVVRGKDPDLDEEAIRVTKSLPKFAPGKMNGHPVNVWYTLPITFKLNQ